MAQQYCEKCRKTMNDTNFYTYKDGTKCELCKACLTMHINNFDPETYMWLFPKFDVPYIEPEWNVLRDRAYQKDPYKMNGQSVFGKYLSKMKLKQFKDFGWADTDRLKTEAEEKAKLYGKSEDQQKQKLEEMRQAYENGEISESQYQTYAETHAPEPTFNFDKNGNQVTKDGFMYPENSNFERIDLVDVGAELTEEDKVYLAMKWGRLYHADEWVALEKLYNDFMASFDIQGAARLDTLKKICKTSLKMDQAIDCGDVDTYQKLSRVYDAMMKSAKFTEAQNKEGKGNFIDSVSELVAFCEKKENGGKIEPYKIDVPLDIVDKVINDLKEYNKTLIYEDKSLAQEIEQYLKKRAALEQIKFDKEEARRKGLDHVEINDEDFQADMERIEQEREEDYLNSTEWEEEE